MHPELVQAVRAARIAREKLELQSGLAKILAENRLPESAIRRRAALCRQSQRSADAGGNFDLSLDGAPRR